MFKIYNRAKKCSFLNVMCVGPHLFALFYLSVLIFTALDAYLFQPKRLFTMDLLKPLQLHMVYFFVNINIKQGTNAKLEGHLLLRGIGVVIPLKS